MNSGSIETHCRLIVKIARDALERFVKSKERLEPPEDVPEQMKRHGRVFVTLYRWNRGSKLLRGCIGDPTGKRPLLEALIDSTVSSALDPRFEPVSEEELDKVAIEVSLLTEPQPQNAPDKTRLLDTIRVGVDGVIVEDPFGSALILPQVAVEEGMDSLDMMTECCLKAGLPPDAWMMPRTKVSLFRAHTCSELDADAKSENVPMTSTSDGPKV